MIEFYVIQTNILDFHQCDCYMYMYVLFIWLLSSHQYLVYMYFLCDLLNMYTYQYMPKLRYPDVMSNVLADDFDLQSWEQKL